MVGEPSDEWGEVVVAVVVPTTDDDDPDALLAFAAEHLAPYKRPRRVRYVDALPRNALGKVVRANLSALRNPALTRFPPRFSCSSQDRRAGCRQWTPSSTPGCAWSARRSPPSSVDSCPPA